MQILKENVVKRYWKVVFGMPPECEPQTISYTIEAETWNRAYLIAMDEKEQIAEFMGVEPSDIAINSLKPIYPVSPFSE